jgi:rhodanese-related sulfurtransferase
VAKTFMQTVNEAREAVPGVGVEEARRRLAEQPNALVVDVRDAGDRAATGVIPGAAHISLGTLTFKADREMPEAWRDPRLADRARPIITTCETGECATLGAKLLKDYGFADVSYLDGGTVAWKEAGLPTEPPYDA